MAAVVKAPDMNGYNENNVAITDPRSSSFPYLPQIISIRDRYFFVRFIDFLD
jgi:hypothetical protein